MVATEMKVHVDKAEIKRINMNPWKKKMYRTIYTDGNRFYIKGNHAYTTAEIEGREYTEVEQVMTSWYIK